MKKTRTNTKPSFPSIEKGRSDKLTARFCTAFTTIYTVAVTSCANVFAAGDIFANVEQTMGNLFSSLFGLSTFIASLLGLICLIVMMCSNGQRETESAKSWLKRIGFSYVGINLLGYGIRIVQDLTAGGQVDWTSL